MEMDGFILGEYSVAKVPQRYCVVKGYTTMLGYWYDEGKTRQPVDQNGRFHTQ